MNLLLLLPLAFTFVCLALVSLLAFLSVVALAGALRVIGTVTSALGFAGRKDEDPWHGAVSDAHPLNYVEARDWSTLWPLEVEALLRTGGLRHRSQTAPPTLT